MKIHHYVKIKPALIFGVGYWKDTYTEGPVRGWCRNIVIPFFRIQIAWLQSEL